MTADVPVQDARGSADRARDREQEAATAVGPTALTRQSWRYTIRMATREFFRDQCLDLAGALTFRSVLAIAPTLLVLVSMLGVVGNGTRAVRGLLDILDRTGVPSDAVAAVEPVIRALADRQDAGWGLVGGLAVALWSVSGYVTTLGRALNRVYEVEEGRPVWLLRPLMLLVTVVTLVVAVLVVAALVLTGDLAAAVGATLGVSSTAVSVWGVAKWPVAVLLVAVLIAFLYWATPNVRFPRFRWVTVGSTLALAVWALSTLGFGTYVSRAGSYEATYGTLAGVVLLLLWLWITNIVLLLGAEVDAEVMRARQLQGGIVAEERLALPLRSDRVVRRREHQRREEVERGRLLRLTAGTMLPPLLRREPSRRR